MSERVYSHLTEQAGAVLRAGHSVIVDAVYARASDRSALERIASTAAVPFIGLWLDAPDWVLIDRTGERHNDASDADAAVVRMQRAADTGDIRWTRLDASASPSSVLASALEQVRQRSDLLNAVHDETR
jgi:predicted kinase